MQTFTSTNIAMFWQLATILRHEEPDPVLHVLGLDELQGQAGGHSFLTEVTRLIGSCLRAEVSAGCSLQRLTVFGGLKVRVARFGLMGPLT